MSRIKLLCLDVMRAASPFLVHLFYGSFWRLRDKCKATKGGLRHLLYFAYLEHCGSYIGLEAMIKSQPIFPHGIKGIFISKSATIGERIVIFQHVTIGSNNLNDGEGGAPYVESDCYIGAGAKIIGRVKLGHHCRIGAGCVVWKDVPPNTTVVVQGNRYITHENANDNTRW